MIKRSTTAWAIASAFSASLLFTNGAIAQDEAMEAPPSATTAVATEVTDATNLVYQCSLNGMTRRIEIDYANAGSSVPCSVNYYKDTEQPNEVSTLWHANNVEGYCEERAEAFAQKLNSWGWSCTNP